MSMIRILGLFIRGMLRHQTALAAENLALRQQLSILTKRRKRPRLRTRDRIFWVWLSRLWAGWRSVLMVVQPDTVVGWHRQGFRLYWRWKPRAKPGRPNITAEIRNLIRRMSRENPLWGPQESNRNSDSLATRRQRSLWTSTESAITGRRHKRGVRSSTTTFETSSRSTSSRYRQRRSAFCSASSCSDQTAVWSSTSTSRRIQLRAGRPCRSSKPFRMTKRLAS